ncbi:S8 family serine peptidase [Spirilliplanes yamanashiensis]|uniref:Peptidase S8/S53 domain-containing protein n=1 Tax=Spirilliplanes yamanashiensis TaxID=42233 RepID=A0A8J3Y798_9ACTN|nr:S8 family serine peptidase [Spirilliplanes yamanashiensis]MDP9817161.1 subtilisin family serine protease [Spirilliplanes yamanashiensis]GIJ03186.1 hypothetical protein Sya03_25380 [Spirilliplanes yamanashiensis]
MSSLLGRSLAAVAAVTIGATALATPSHAAPAPAPAPAEGVVHGVGAAGAVPGRYIVVLKPGAARVTSLGAGRVERTLSGGVDGYVAAMDAATARRVAADPAVAVVEQDRRVSVSATQRKPPWGLDRVDEAKLPLSKTYTPGSDARRVTAYVVDTGIRITHTQFGGRARYGWDFVGVDPYAADCNGHGTHVAGTIGGSTYGVAKRVNLVAVRVLDCYGSGWLSDVIDGVNWVAANAVKPAVANLSLGGGPSAALDSAVNAAVGSGVTMVLAAGNDNINACRVSPARVAAGITVGATDIRDRRAVFSNYGSCVDIFAPGVKIRSSVATSNTAVADFDGTSMAAPHVAGAAAMILAAAPWFTPAQVRSFMVSRATTGVVKARGAGSPNRLVRTIAPPAAPRIRTAALPTGSTGVEYRAQLALVAGRTGQWTAAALPAGLTLSPGGVLSGVPTAPGTHRVTLRFTDYVPQTVSRTYTLTIL